MNSVLCVVYTNCVVIVAHAGWVGIDFFLKLCWLVVRTAFDSCQNPVILRAKIGNAGLMYREVMRSIEIRAGFGFSLEVTDIHAENALNQLKIAF